MNHEDESFLQFFDNQLSILRGSHRPLTDCVAEAKEHGRMFRITAANQSAAIAFEQDGVAAHNLNSGDTYLVVTPGLAMAYLWKGAGSNEEEEHMGGHLLESLVKCEGKQQLEEGQEPDEFWEALGGKAEYLKHKDLRVVPGFEPRLFNVSNALGVLFVKEVPNFT